MTVCKDCRAEGITTSRPAPHPGPRCATHHRAFRQGVRRKAADARVTKVYGLTAEEYDRLYAHQGGRCAICRRATGASRRLAVDHDHRTGEVRGLLCKSDNRLLGFARDDVEFFQRAVAYLTEPPAAAIGLNRVVP